MNGLTFAQHIVALCDIIIVVLLAFMIFAVVIGLAGSIAYFFLPKEDDILEDDDLRQVEFLKEVRSEQNTKEN